MPWGLADAVSLFLAERGSAMALEREVTAAPHRSMRVDYVVERNVGTVGRPSVPCAVCGVSPSRHVLSARVDLNATPEFNKGLCNVHAQGLVQDGILGEEELAEMRDNWQATR